MLKSIAAFLLAPFAAVALPATQVMATVIPPIGLAPGSHYQLIFVTQDGTQATSTDINFYNAFVANEASLNPLLPPGVIWHAVGTTPSLQASVNAPSNALPVYNTQGQLIVPSGLYISQLTNPIMYNQFGSTPSDANPIVWTGMGNGTNFFKLGDTAFSDAWFGDAESILGWSHATLADEESHQEPGGVEVLINGVIAGFAVPTHLSNHMYALSAPLVVPTPEPTTIVLLASGLMLIGGIRFLRWRRKAR